MLCLNRQLLESGDGENVDLREKQPFPKLEMLKPSPKPRQQPQGTEKGEHLDQKKSAKVAFLLLGVAVDTGLSPAAAIARLEAKARFQGFHLVLTPQRGLGHSRTLWVLVHVIINMYT